MVENHNLSSHLEILKNLVLKNLRVRYKASALGFLWAFLNPLFTMVIFYPVFSKILKIEVRHYPLFLLSALLPWIFFSSSLTDTARSIINNANLVKKASFPSETLPISCVVSNLGKIKIDDTKDGL